MGENIPSRHIKCTSFEKPFLFRCDCCGKGIYNGEFFYNIDGKNFHSECISENYTTAEILELVGIKKEIA